MQNIITFMTQHPYLFMGIFFVTLLLVIIECMRLKKMGGLSPQTAVQMMNHEHAIVLDLRSESEFKKSHIVHAQNITAEALMSGKKLDKMKNKPLILVGTADMITNNIVSQLTKKGHHAYNLRGGMKAWYDAKLPTVSESHHA